MNLIKNAKITTEDINLTEKAYGPDVGSIKAKTTRTSPTPVFSNIIDIPAELLHILKNTEEYNPEVSTVIARIMCHFQECNDKSGKKSLQFVQTYNLKQGIKNF